MSLITWRKEYCTGIPGVDYEHEKLIEQINAVYALIDEKGDKEQIIDCLGDIYGSIAAHFALEEKMMERRHYDRYEEHRTDHEKLLDDIRDITEEFENTHDLNDQQFKQKLNDWFQMHFKTHDARLHSLAKFRSHEQVEKSVLQSMIRSAKNALLGKTG